MIRIKFWELLRLQKVSIFFHFPISNPFCLYITDSRQVEQGTYQAIAGFLQSDGNQQRFLFDDSSEKNKLGARGVIKAFFGVIDKIQSDQDTTYYSLCQINGILEDLRSRINHFVEVMNHFKDSMNLIRILIGFLQKDNSQDNKMRDIASHILALLIE